MKINDYGILSTVDSMIARRTELPPDPPPTNPARPCLSWAGKTEGAARVFSGLTDGISRGIESAGAGLSETLFDSTLRLAVPGLSPAHRGVEAERHSKPKGKEERHAAQRQ